MRAHGQPQGLARRASSMGCVPKAWQGAQAQWGAFAKDTCECTCVRTCMQKDYGCTYMCHNDMCTYVYTYIHDTTQGLARRTRSRLRNHMHANRASTNKALSKHQSIEACTYVPGGPEVFSRTEARNVQSCTAASCPRPQAKANEGATPPMLTTPQGITRERMRDLTQGFSAWEKRCNGSL